MAFRNDKKFKNMYSPDKRSSKYMKKNWNTKEKNKFIHTTIGDFNVFSTPDRTSRKKKKKNSRIHKIEQHYQPNLTL